MFNHLLKNIDSFLVKYNKKILIMIWIVSFITFLPIWALFEKETIGDAFYLYFVVVSTLGFGEITPSTFVGKILIIVTVMLSILTFTNLIYLFTRGSKQMVSTIKENTQLVIYENSGNRINTIKNIISDFKEIHSNLDEIQVAIIVDGNHLWSEEDIKDVKAFFYKFGKNCLYFVKLDDILIPQDLYFEGYMVYLNDGTKSNTENLERGLAIGSIYEANNEECVTIVECCEIKDFLHTLNNVDQIVPWSQGIEITKQFNLQIDRDVSHNYVRFK